MAIIRVELPGVFLDNLVEDSVVSSTDDTPVLINQDPEPNETKVDETTDISLDIATISGTGSIDTNATSIYINNVLAFQAGVFQAGFNGADSTYSNPQSDVLRVVIDPLVDFISEEVVFVRVVSAAVGSTSTLDTTYMFTTADTLPPRVIAASAIDQNRVRVTFSESVDQTSTTSTASALDPANWVVDRLGDYIDPVVSVNVVSVEGGIGFDTVDLVTDIPLTPNGYYRATASLIQDVSGNALDGNNTADFLGWVPPAPDGRSFVLYDKLPEINVREDDTLDLYRFVACLQEVFDLLLYDIDKFIELFDPDTAPEDFVDAMLADLGNPFAFDLSLTDKRRLTQILVAMYQLKGTQLGIQNVVRFFLGIEVTIDQFSTTEAWILGESELGIDAILGTSESDLLYTFQVSVLQALTDDQRSRIRSIVNYMKPAHTHFGALIEPTPPPPVEDHMVLGVSLLGETWLLH